MTPHVFPPALRLCSEVSRFGMARVLRRQSIAEHMFYVAHYAMDVAQIIQWHGNRAELLAYAIHHDLDEVITTDIPGPVKRSFGPLNMDYTERLEKKWFGVSSNEYAIDPEIKAIVKVADRIEEIMYGAVETSLGNRVNGDAIMDNGYRMLTRALVKLNEYVPETEILSGIIESVRDQVSEILTQALSLPNHG